MRLDTHETLELVGRDVTLNFCSTIVADIFPARQSLGLIVVAVVFAALLAFQ